MKRTFKNKAAISCASLLAFMVFFGVGFSLNTKNVHAQAFVPVFDNANFLQNSQTNINTQALVQKEYTLDGIVTTAMKLVISNITDSIVQWINSGFQGNPAFISNPQSFFTNVGDQIAGNFIAGSELGFLCEPFQLDIRFALNFNYSGATFKKKIGCTLSDVLENIDNFTSFTQGDFAKGGWSGWLSVSQNSQNNPYGAYLDAKSEMAIRLANGKKIELMKLDWSGGFLSFTDNNGNIQTPGTVIEGQLENVLGSGVRQFELADEINEIVAALFQQLIQQVIGPGGLINQ